MNRIASRRLFIGALLLAALVVAIDQASKLAILDYFKEHTSPVRLTGFFNLVLVFNQGVSFGIFNHDIAYMPLVLIGVAIVITALLLVWLARTASTVTAAALGLLIGGAIGNMIDRFHAGAVIDFLNFYAFGWHWPAFNVADSAIVCGAGLLLLQGLVFDKENRQSS